jgi:hypothetical protein
VRITSYQVNTPNYRPGAVVDRPGVLQRQVMISAQVQIVDQVNNEIYWEDNSLRGDGPVPRAGRDRGDRRRSALKVLFHASSTAPSPTGDPPPARILHSRTG